MNIHARRVTTEQHTTSIAKNSCRLLLVLGVGVGVGVVCVGVGVGVGRSQNHWMAWGKPRSCFRFSCMPEDTIYLV